ncbi:MAG: alpha/beta hydrolase [Parvularculaceae bacterium]
MIRATDRYAGLTLPVAIVTGESDKTVSPERHSKRLAREVKGASLTLLPDTGHALHHAETETILAIIDGMPAR